MEKLAAIAASLVEAAGILAVVGGGLLSALQALRHLRRHRDPTAVLRDFRQGVGRSILLGMEFLVGADILRTVTGVPDLQSLAVLGGVVLIRTVLSFTLEVELHGAWPWQPRPAIREQESREGSRPA